MRRFRRGFARAATVPGTKTMARRRQVMHKYWVLAGTTGGNAAMTPSPACFALVQQFEGCARKQPDGTFAAYPDPGTGAEPWTIGWGSTGADIQQGLVWTQQQCDARLAQDLTSFGAKVAAAIGSAPTSQPQFVAMVSFAYHVGIGYLASSTLLKLHKAGDFAGAQAQFGRWNKAAGKVLPGLVKRRAAEAALYGS